MFKTVYRLAEFLIFTLIVFQSLIALTANVFPPSVIRLYRGHIMLILEKRVSRLWMSEFLTSIELIYIGKLYESFTRL